MAPISSTSSPTICSTDYRNESYTKALTDVVNTYKPEILLLGATTLGRDLAGSVATTLLTGLTADCTALDVDTDGSLAATRPTFGGSLMCTIYTLNYRPQMATVRPRVMPMPERVARDPGRIVTHPLGLVEDDIVTKVLSFLPDRESAKSNLAYADVVVAGGLGLGSPENFQLVRQLASVLGAEYGCSRPLVQKGWVTSDRQIGQTGKTIRPKLYIAAGISGAIQHRVGVEGADLIVAINTDKNAPIFDFAHVGIITDAIRLLPALTEAFRARLSPHSRDRIAAKEERAMIEEKFDAIVVGAGMAGNAAALTLAQRGLKVLQLERGEYSGSKNVQGAILYADMLEKLIPDFREDAPLERHLVEQRFWMMDDRAHVGLHYRSDDFNEERPNRYTIIRAQFDKWFSSQGARGGRHRAVRDHRDRTGAGRLRPGDRRAHRSARRRGACRRGRAGRRRQRIARHAGRPACAAEARQCRARGQGNALPAARNHRSPLQSQGR